MATEYRARCTKCRVQWWEVPTVYVQHECPAEPECDAPQYHDGSATKWYRYCPRCGVALTTEGA